MMEMVATLILVVIEHLVMGLVVMAIAVVAIAVMDFVTMVLVVEELLKVILMEVLLNNFYHWYIYLGYNLHQRLDLYIYLYTNNTLNQLHHM